jgi:phospholipid N-methyltransferase
MSPAPRESRTTPPATHENGERPPRKRLPDWLLFLGKFLRHGRQIASFIPSSVWLSRAVIRGLDLARASVIVELGAGTGPITAELLRAAPPTCRCIIIERDHDFCVRLRERFPRAEILEADAADLDTILRERGIDRIDHVLCGLPLPSFPAPVRDRVLESVISHLVPDGQFRQLTHMPWVYRRLYRRYFEEVRFRLVLRNFPPAGFYVCRRNGS